MPQTRTVQTYTCRDCGTEPVDNQGELCETCSNEGHFNCGYCNDLTHNEDGNSTESHGTVCSNCISTRFQVCHECGYYYHRNRIVYSDSRAEYFCRDCYDNDPDPEPDDDNDSSDCDRVHDYSHRPETIFHGDKGIERGYTVKREEYTSYYGSIGYRDAYIPAKTRFFGVELECNSEDKDDDSSFTLKALNGNLTNESHAYLKEDGSIDGGFEIVTHPHTLKAQRALWQKFFSGKWWETQFSDDGKDLESDNEDEIISDENEAAYQEWLRGDNDRVPMHLATHTGISSLSEHRKPVDAPIASMDDWWDRECRKQDHATKTRLSE